jgi:hypothetical protein
MTGGSRTEILDQRSKDARVGASRPTVQGVWSLISCEVKSGRKMLDQPYGPNPRGYLIYTADGYMSVDFMAAERPPSGDPETTPIGDRLLLAKTYHSYCGRYSFDGKSVFHHVEVSLEPEAVGTTKVRTVTFDRGRLVLEAAIAPVTGPPAIARIVWKRRE